MNSMNVKQIDQKVCYQEWTAIIKECPVATVHIFVKEKIKQFINRIRAGFLLFLNILLNGMI